MNNVVRSLKGIGTSIVTSLVIIIPVMIARYFQGQLTMPFISLLFGLVGLVLYLLAWGYFAKRFWGWT